MIAHKLTRAEWPSTTVDAQAVWTCSKGRGRAKQEFFIFKLKPRGYVVREKGSWGWFMIGEQFDTLGQAKLAAERE